MSSERAAALLVVPVPVEAALGELILKLFAHNVVCEQKKESKKKHTKKERSKVCHHHSDSTPAASSLWEKCLYYIKGDRSQLT